jgi:hypothetical protein
MPAAATQVERQVLGELRTALCNGLPISSATAESAVNQVVSSRMAKKRQMRWSDQGAHLLAQVRVNVLNGELRPRVVPIPLRPIKPKSDPSLDAYLLQEAA